MKKLLYTLLAVSIIFSACKKEDDTPQNINVYGCLDTLAFNYNPLATVDDISCIYTKAIIIVKDSDGDLVSNAQVTLSPGQIISPGGEYPDPVLTKTHNTDANGEAEFIYELEAILNIEVIKESGNSTYTGVNIIRLIEGLTVTKIVEIN